MILNDAQIIQQVKKHNLIVPFSKKQISKKQISYGLSSFGYDICLSPKKFQFFERKSFSFINPKKFNAQRTLSNAVLRSSEWGNYFILPGLTTGLGVSVEHFNMPDNVTAIAVGKSTYARCGINVLVTPLEAGWQGYLTIEISNTTPLDCAIYANEGILQLIFFQGEDCKTSYAKRKGKYQNQLDTIVYPKIK